MKLRTLLLAAMAFAASTPALPAQDPAAAKTAPAGGYQPQTVQVQGQEFAYQLLKPATVEAGKTYPLILFLHGAGERGTDNQAQLKHFAGKMASPARQAKYPCFLIAVQCRPEQKWSDVDWSATGPIHMQAKPTLMHDYAVAALDQVLASQPVDKTRLMLTGISMGGYGTWDMAIRYPERFACAAPICGGGDATRASVLKALPLGVWHGGADNVVIPLRSQEMVAAIKAAGSTVLKYTELPGVGHDSWTAAYAPESGLLDWMFAQQRKP